MAEKDSQVGVIQLNSKRKISIASKKTRIADKDRMRERMLGEKNPFYGKTHTKETMDKIKKKLTGRKISNPKPVSEAHKAAISATMKFKGIIPPSRKGVSPTAEDRKKKSEAMKAYWAAKKELL
jgi:hypothetical protein